ncbi:MAG: tetratricopeptide repeat protein, partial [Candidatus Dormibacteraeota bacterium]|nr:tetratricopeptide repeat protein [Candidatus Dormibacteraeota bacterium]
MQRAQRALAQGDLRQARLICQGILARDALEADARYLLGLSHALADEPEAAIANWQQVLEMRPWHFAALGNLGVALSRQGEHAAAVEHLRAAVAIDGSQPTMHCNLGNSLLSLGDVEGAIGTLKAALALDPHLAAAHNSLGAAYRRAGRTIEARAEFEAASFDDP